MAKQESNDEKLTIFYVDFKSPIPLSIGPHASLEYWSADKHGKHVTLTERGNWVVLQQVDGPARIRVPMTNVGCLKERAE